MLLSRILSAKAILPCNQTSQKIGIFFNVKFNKMHFSSHHCQRKHGLSVHVHKLQTANTDDHHFRIACIFHCASIHTSMSVARRYEDSYLMREVEATLTAETKQVVKLFSSTGELLGAMNKKKAQQIAKSENLRLVCIKEKTNPPLYKLMTGLQLYEERMQEKRERKTRKIVGEKIIKISSKISGHDLGIKFKQIHQFLNKGHQVKLSTRMASDLKTEEDVADAQATLFKNVCTEYCNKGQVSDASRSKNELNIVIKPVNEEDQ